MQLASRTLADPRLYKYRGIPRDARDPSRYDEQKLPYVRDIFLNGTLYFPSPREVNDPLDSRPLFTIGNLSDPAYRRAYIEHFSTMMQRRGIGPRTPEQLEAWLQSHTQEQAQGLTETSTGDYREMILNKYRLCSFSATAENPLLWAHYADSHRGICLVFDTRNDVFGSAIKVDYSEQYPTIDIIEADAAQVLMKSSVKKFIDWQYEKEYRLVSSEPTDPGLLELDHQRFRYDPRHLTGVIFGCRTPPEDRELVQGWCASSSRRLTFYEARLNNARYRLDIVQL